jgi:hypothetical protein
MVQQRSYLGMYHQFIVLDGKYVGIRFTLTHADEKQERFYIDFSVIPASLLAYLQQHVIIGNIVYQTRQGKPVQVAGSYAEFKDISRNKAKVKQVLNWAQKYIVK